MGIEDDLDTAQQDAGDALDLAQEVDSKVGGLEDRIDELEARLAALEAKLSQPAPPKKKDGRTARMKKVWAIYSKHKDEAV